MVGGALLHDLLVAPVVILVGVAVARTVPGRARAVVQAALVVTAVVALFSYPLVRAYGLAANNPTSLPHNYAANLALVLGLVWTVAALAILLRTCQSASPPCSVRQANEAEKSHGGKRAFSCPYQYGPDCRSLRSPVRLH